MAHRRRCRRPSRPRRPPREGPGPRIPGAMIERPAEALHTNHGHRHRDPRIDGGGEIGLHAALRDPGERNPRPIDVRPGFQVVDQAHHVPDRVVEERMLRPCDMFEGSGEVGTCLPTTPGTLAVVRPSIATATNPSRRCTQPRPILRPRSVQRDGRLRETGPLDQQRGTLPCFGAKRSLCDRPPDRGVTRLERHAGSIT